MHEARACTPTSTTPPACLPPHRLRHPHLHPHLRHRPAPRLDGSHCRTARCQQPHPAARRLQRPRRTGTVLLTADCGDYLAKRCFWRFAVWFGGRDWSPKVTAKAFRAGFQRKPSGSFDGRHRESGEAISPSTRVECSRSLPLIRPRVGIERTNWIVRTITTAVTSSLFKVVSTDLADPAAVA